MTVPVWCCTRWNDLTRRPIAGYEWIDADRARGLRAHHEFFDVVDAGTIEDGLPRPRWVIHSSASFGVDFLDVHGSIWRTVVYRWTDERLWRLTTTDYTYPDGEQRWDLPDATLEVEASVLPDGTGQLIVDDAESLAMKANMTGASVSGVTIHEAIGVLAAQRPVFHSEADFQFALAAALQNVLPDAAVRLEVPKRLDTGRTEYLDLQCTTADGVVTAIVQPPKRL